MRPQVTAPIASVTTSAPLVMDSKQSPFNVGFGVVMSGTLTYTVEHTFDNILGGATPTWFPNATVAAAVASANGNYAFPVTAIRLNVTAYTSGQAVLTVLQGSSQ
jgi:hypothetical protein